MLSQSKLIFGLTEFFAPKKYVRCIKTKKEISKFSVRRTVFTSEEALCRMFTSVRNALWARAPRSGAKTVACLDKVCDRPRSHN